MSNRVEYAWIAVLLITAMSAFFYERTESSPDQDHPNILTIDGVGLTTMDNSSDDRRQQASHSAREKEDGRGLNQLGMMYLLGTGARRDLSAAFLFFSWAAQTGDASAMNNLGTMYEKGWGTDSDRRKALELYAEAADLGNQLARDNLQRLRASFAEPGTTLPSTPGSTTSATVSLTRDPVESSMSGKPKPIRVTARYTWGGARSDMGEEIALQSSPDTGWSTGAIPLTSSVAAQNPAPPQTEKHRRSNVPGKPPFTRSVARLLPQEPELQKPSASKIPAKGKIRMNERADQSVSNNPRAKTTTELDFVAPADDLSNQPCAVGNWTGTPRC
jgi:hypothetical protein